MAAITNISPSAVAELPPVQQLDVRIIEKLRPVLETPVAQKIGSLGHAGDDRLLLLLSAGILSAGLIARNGKLQRTGFRMLVAQLVAKGAKEFGKNNVDRTRPSKQLEEGRYVAKAGSSQTEGLRSFPSGHAASALAVARAFSREYPRYTKPVIAAAGVIGALQIPRRANYPGDVAAGAGAGLFAEKLSDGIIAGVEKVRTRRLSRRVKAFS
ncbi:MAG: phosphatase PAP2 family protein [Sphingobium sp.]